MRRLTSTALAIAAAIALAGCVSEPEPAAPAMPAPVPTATDPLTNPSQAPDATVPVPTPIIGELHAHPEGDETAPPLEEDGRAVVLQRAAEAVTAFCQPALGAADWLGGLNPYLTQRAGAAFQTVDPANIPCSAVSGDAAFLIEPNEHYTETSVPTDAGDFTVVMERFDLSQPWLAERIQPAQ